MVQYVKLSTHQDNAGKCTLGKMYCSWPALPVSVWIAYIQYCVLHQQIDQMLLNYSDTHFQIVSLCLLSYFQNRKCTAF